MANWTSQWKAAKTAFEAKIGQKKPSAATMTAIRKGGGLDDALKICDTEFAAMEAAKDGAGKVALVPKFTAAIKAFDVKVAGYQRALVAAVGQADGKLIQTELTFFSRQLYALSAKMKTQLRTATVAAQHSKGDEIIARNLLTSFLAALAKARIFAIKVTRVQGPTSPQIFQAGVVQVSVQIMGHAPHFQRLLAKGYEFPHGDPANLFKIMAQWSQNKRKLPPTAAPDLVKREIAAYIQALNGMEKWAKG